MLPNRALAPTTFFTGPSEELATADTYEIKDAGVINKVAPITVNENSLADELRGGASMLSKLPMLSTGEILKNATIASEWKTVAKVDVLPANPLNSLKASVAGDGKGFMATMQNMGSTIYKALGGVNGIRDIARSDATSLLTRAATGGFNGIPGLAGLNGLSSLGSILNTGALPPVVSTMLSVAIPPKYGAYATMAGITQKLPGNQLSEAYQMSSLINELVPGSAKNNIVDRDASSRLISALAIGGMSTGLPNAFSSVVPLSGDDLAIAKYSGKIAMDYAAGTGNVHGVKDVISAIGKQNILGGRTTVMESLAKNFSFGSDNRPETRYSKPFSDVTGVFDDLDEKWLREDIAAFDPTSGQTLTYPLIDISVAREGNADFREMMTQGAKTTTNEDLQCFALTQMFEAKPPEQELKEKFPMTATSITSKSGVDPYTLPPKLDPKQRAKKVETQGIKDGIKFGRGFGYNDTRIQFGEPTGRWVDVLTDEDRANGYTELREWRDY